MRLSDVKAVRAALGGTVNDVVLDDRHRWLPRPAPGARRGRRGPDGPHAGAGVGAPTRRARRLQQPRLGDVRRAAGRARRPGDATRRRSARRWTASSSPSRPWPATCSRRSRASRRRCCWRSAARLAPRSPRSACTPATRTCRGPSSRCTTLGRRMLESFPFVPVIGQARISIAIFSYDGGLYFGVTGDYDSSQRHRRPDRPGLERSMAELLALAAPPPTSQAPAGRAKAGGGGRRAASLRVSRFSQRSRTRPRRVGPSASRGRCTLARRARARD